MPFRWDRKTDDQVLDMPLAKLPIQIKGSWLEDKIERLYDELKDRGLNFRPHCWLSEEWFSPDGVPGIAIPFYLSHPRLRKLEQRFMVEVEGGSEAKLMRVLRHEAGHAFDTAYRLHYRRRWQELFGSFATRYPDSYLPRPNSRNFVLHLPSWYAQSHPAEDFAETFAVWLTPGSSWRRRYKGWGALKKLEYVDELMQEIAGTAPAIRTRRKVEPFTESHMTLREYYEQKKESGSIKWPAFYDTELLQIFSREKRFTNGLSASMFLRLYRRDLVEAVAEVTNVHPYTIVHILDHAKERCKAMHLQLRQSERATWEKMLILLTMQTMNAVHSGYFRLSL